MPLTQINTGTQVDLHSLGNAQFIVGNSGVILEFAEEGTALLRDVTPGTDDLYDVWGDNLYPQNFYAVGANGTILHAVDRAH